MTSTDAKVAYGLKVTAQHCTLAYRQIRNEVMYELLAHLLHVKIMDVSDVRWFAKSGHERIFGSVTKENQFSSPTNFGRALQKSLGSYLAKPTSQYWINWFLAYPIDRQSSDKVKVFASAIVNNTAAILETASEVTSFFTETTIGTDHPVYAICKEHLDMIIASETGPTKKQLTDGEGTILEAMAINLMARFVLIHSSRIPTSISEIDTAKLNSSFPLDTYALTAFGVGLGSQILASFNDKSMASIDSTIDTAPFGKLKEEEEEAPKFLIRTALPWRASLSVIEFLWLHIAIDVTFFKDTKAFHDETIAIRTNTSISLGNDVKTNIYANEVIKKYGNETVAIDDAIVKLTSAIQSLQQQQRR